MDQIPQVKSSFRTMPYEQPRLGSYIYILTAMAVIGGFLFGYDTGIVSEAMLYVVKDSDMKPVNDVWHEFIVGVTPGMAGIGALLSGVASDKFGRRKTILASSAIFTIGGVVCAIAFDKWVLLVGRMLNGFAIGIASMIVPIYVSEASPANIRGKLVTGFQLFLTFGLISANVLAGIFSYVDPERVGWRIMFGFAAVPSIIQFICFLYLPESPRYLYDTLGRNSCKDVLIKIYNGNKQWIMYELEEIKIAYEQQVREQIELGIEETEIFMFRRVLKTPHVRKALMIGCALQAFQQFSGINTVMYYSGVIFQSSGIINKHTNIWISCVTVGVKVMATFIPIYIIEKKGRKKLLVGSMILVILSSLALGGTFLLINNDTAENKDTPRNNWTNRNVDNFDICRKYSNCDYCVTNEHCGFCSLKGHERIEGYCLPTSYYDASTRSKTGYCQTETSSDDDILHNITNKDGKIEAYEWAYEFCHTSKIYTALSIIFVIIFISSFSAGYGPVPWVLNSEFYPLWARSTCASIATFTNWMFNLLVSNTFLSLVEAITKFGTFFVYALLTIIGLVLFIFVLPETKGLNLEEIEMLFMDEKARLEKEEVLRIRHYQEQEAQDKNNRFSTWETDI